MNYTAATPTTWTFTDSATPTTPSAQPAGAAPIGTTLDAAGVRHTHRVYYTFDLSAYRDQAVHVANLWTNETRVADCGVTAPVEVWRTGPVTAKSTWRRAPTELERVAERTLGKGVACPGGYLGVDVTGQVTAALARHERTISFEVRLAAAAEGNPQAARSLQPLHLSMSTNHVPTLRDLRLKSPDRPCGTLARPSTAGNLTYFTATGADADPDQYPSAAFALWPVGHPEQRTPFATSGGAAPTVSTDLRAYADGTVLAWSAQPSDHDDTGGWARTCYLTVDNTAPATAPVITARRYVEPQYPGAGGPGVAGTFILDAQGDRDVVAFDYYEAQSSITTQVRANHPGGRARISVAPKRWGDDELRARAVDAAGNRGPWQSYRFYVRDTAPSIELTVTGVGTPSTITLYARAAEVTSFGYTVDGGAEARVPAVGGQGTGTIVFTSAGTRTVVSHSYAGKKLIGTSSKQIFVDDAPGVSSAKFLFPAQPVLGDQGTFTFTPHTTGVVAYLYDLGDEGQKRVEAAADGTATLSWTAANPGYFAISVMSVTADGTRSAASYDQFYVADTRPAIYSEAGTCCPVRDGVGVPLNVWISSELPDVTHFVYSFDGGPEQTTTEGSSVYVTVTPTHVGDSTFTARAVLADGTLSPPATITMYIINAPLVTNAGPYGEQAVLGRESTLTFKPATPDVVSYRYYWDYDPDTAQTADAAANGSATVTWTTSTTGTRILNAVAVSRDGSESDPRQIYVDINDPAVLYTGTWGDIGPTGGVGLPGRLGFYADGGGLLDVTTKYLWHVDDGPVRETPVDDQALVTYVPYTPDHGGENILYVQRQFTDGALSPVRQYRLLVGTEPGVFSAEYPAGAWSGGAGVPGTFHFTEGTAAIVSYDYRFVDSNGTVAATGTVRTDANGAADVTFTPTAANTWYTLTVAGRTSNDVLTTAATYSFGVAPS
jgi:hypothetical protein